MGGNTGTDVQPHSLRRDPHARLHGREVTEGDLPGGELPQEDGVAPHVRRSGVDVCRTFLQCLKQNIKFDYGRMERIFWRGLRDDQMSEYLIIYQISDVCIPLVRSKLADTFCLFLGN